MTSLLTSYAWYGSTFREDRFDIRVKIHVSAFPTRTAGENKKSILKMRTDRHTDRMTNPQTDTSTHNKGRYKAEELANQ